MSDDLRERTPLRDQADNPDEAGTRSDRGASGGGATGIPPAAREPAANNAEPLTGQGTGAGGGYGSGSGDGSSGGSQERTDGASAGDGDETAWLRDAASTFDDGTAAGDDATNDDGIATRGERGLGAQGVETE